MQGSLALALPTFLYPLGFAVLAAVPVLLSIYFLHNKARRHVVSSLMLWSDERETREGGLNLRRLETPLLFFLEFTALLLFAVAAAVPMMQSGQSSRPLVVVLDNSFSMLANKGEPLEEAMAAIEQKLRGDSYQPLRFVLAEEEPRLIGDAVYSLNDARRQLNGWSCQAATANLAKAVAFAYEIGGSRAVILVVTDQTPLPAMDSGRLEWWAFGRKTGNTAFVNATRGARESDRCLLEIANLGFATATTWLTIRQSGEVASEERIPLQLQSDEVKRLVFSVKIPGALVTAVLADDSLLHDNVVSLLPVSPAPVQTEVRIKDSLLRQLTERALAASGMTTMVHRQPQLILRDHSQAGAEESDAWLCEFVCGAEATPYVGPFVLDHTHPLAEGLTFEGLVWGSSKGDSLPGMPVLMVGNIPIISDTMYASGRHHVYFNFQPAFSNLQNTPNWPILLWNLLQWRVSHLPGVGAPNIRLGSEAYCTWAAAQSEVEITLPDGTRQQRRAAGKNLAIKPERKGVYEVRSGSERYRFVVNALSREESDLRQAASGRWGNWHVAATRQWEVRHVSWLFLLLSLFCLLIHLWLVQRATQGKIRI
jgi:hypothetical protein